MVWHPPRVASSVDELTTGATDRVEITPDDGKSGSRYWTLCIDDQRYFLKTVSYESDWLMRVTGDLDHRTWKIWTKGLMEHAPAAIDHTVVGMALEGTGTSATLGQLMRDVGDHLVPEGDEPLTAEEHAGFIDAMADLSATFWGWDDAIGLKPLEDRPRFFAPDNIAAELASGDVPGPIAAADAGWTRLPERAPGVARVTAEIHRDPGPITRALRTTPPTFLHGDWKAGNLGRHPDGRTILLDWAYPGSGPACWDLTWYLSLNAARLPESKDDVIERFRGALESRGIDTRDWWDTQLDLSLLDMTACMGWEKALGSDEELAWWVDRVERAAPRVPELASLL